MRTHSSRGRRVFATTGITLLSLLAALVATLGATATPAAAALSGADDTVFAFGSAAFRGSTSAAALASPIKTMATTPDGTGYWLVADDGGIFSYGAPFFGSLGAARLNAPIVAMAPAPDNLGYWLLAEDGGVFTFGSAVYFGSMGGQKLNSPMKQIIPTASGRGYWLLAEDGGVFTFGDAPFHGSTGAMKLNAPIVAMGATPSGRGYWLLGGDGGIFTFGDAAFLGSTGAMKLNAPVVGMASTGSGRGYWLVGEDGGIFTFGDAQYLGSAAGQVPAGRRVVQITGVPAGDGYRILALARPRDVALVGLNATGPGVADVQTRLLNMGYWLPGVSGRYDSVTQQAVFAFQKVNGVPRTGAVDAATRDAFRRARRPLPRSTSGYQIEIDKARQVLIVASGGRASWIFNASSGSDRPYTFDGVRYSAHTPEGMWNIGRVVDGVDRGPLGDLYRPRYFTNTGIAVHGYSSVPPTPASHGCVRVSNAAIDYMWGNNVLPIGTSVWVY